ncbi:MAG: phospholipase [Myxococcales bacterium]|nr:phospholipase [Myxococcales bacterium]
MRQKRLGQLDALLAGGPDREGGGDGPLVVLNHGFGAPGDDLAMLWRVLDVPRETRFVFPAAPLGLPMMGDARAWWMIDFEQVQAAMANSLARDLSSVEPQGLLEAREALYSLLDAVERELRVPPQRTVIGGFSQGAMLALDAVLRRPRAYAGLALLSGSLLCRDVWEPLVPRIAGMPVLQSHGRHDMLLSFQMAKQLSEMLRAGGVDASFLDFGGGHEIPVSVVERLGAFITEVLTDKGDDDSEPMM